MKYIIKKITALIVTLFVISLLAFAAFQIIPGDSAVTALGTDASAEDIAALRKEKGLDEALPARYFKWLGNALRGEFGTSLQYNLPVTKLLKERLPVTAGLAVLSFSMIALVSVPVGILSVQKEGGILDHSITAAAHLCMAVPPFFLGMLITLIFGLVLHWFQPGGYVSPEENISKFLYSLIFPAIAVAIPKIGMMVRFLRSSLLSQLKLDYVRTAKSKGDTKNQVLYRHVLKNGLIPVVTFYGMMIAEIMAGSIIIEQVFNLPGLGRLLVTAISNRDFPVVQAIVIYIAFVVIFVNFLVDILYQVIDPRVRNA